MAVMQAELSAVRRALFMLLLLLLPPMGNAAPRLVFTLDEISHPVFNVRTLQFDLVAGPQGKQLEIDIGEVAIKNRIWRHLKLQCQDFQLTRHEIACDAGRLRIAGKILPVTFRYTLDPQRLLLTVKPGADESWHLTLNWQNSIWQARLQISNGSSSLVAGWLPQDERWPQLQAGSLNGVIDMTGYGSEIAAWAANLEVRALAFSDAQGLHAGEHVVLRLDARATQKKTAWHWQGALVWPSGEIFWQPFYFEGAGQQLTVGGTLHNDRLVVEQSALQISGMGTIRFMGEIDRIGQRFEKISLQAEKLELSTLFSSIIQPLTVDTALAETTARGKLDIDWCYQDGDTQSLVLKLQDVALTDTQGRFAVAGVHALIPWHSNRTAQGSIQLASGEILHIPLGEMEAVFMTHAHGFSVPNLTVPVLDGGITVENLEVKKASAGWQWRFNGKLLPVSMEKLTGVLEMTPMFGNLSGIVPQMTYADGVMTMEGVLVFEIFDGVAVARNLTFIEPLGRTPRLLLDVGMHHIDLDLLTRAYSFGNMQGRIDVEINDIELVSWQPVRFDARLVSSPGSYRKRISQAAVQNLTALGGASAAGMIQRSFLQLFKDFGYKKIGWRCRLHGNICQMDGIEATDPVQYAFNQTEDYVLVQGSGIPAINITGYNRLVDWRELVKRLNHAIESGSPTIH